MEQQSIDKIVKTLKDHNICTIATVDKEGNPLAHTVTYISEGLHVYFSTNPASRKAVNFRLNSTVAYTIDKYVEDWSETIGLQVTAKVAKVDEASETAGVMRKFMKKFPQVMKFPPEYISTIKLYKLIPLEIIYLDNSQGFGYSEKYIMHNE
ncbi:MAG: pyridoxamine 5-phosphate oxidase [Marinilabiliales bacterium]|nr:MAG: pyridoxamine 5-phosphate oxidase [Marinilabiliales bacterium]